MSVGRPRLARLAAAALAVASAGAPGAVSGLEGFPGSTWGDLYYEIPSPGANDLVLEGWIKQGVAWKRWPVGNARLVLQTYATLRYKWDSLGLDWNNYLGPGAGIAVDLDLPRFPVVSGGVEYIHQWNTQPDVALPYTALFLNWFGSWDIRKGGWPGSTWGDLRWEVPNAGSDDLILEGWVRQGWVLHRWKPEPYAFVLSPYVRVRYKLDTLGLDWNNYAGPGVGLALDVDGLKGFQPAAGIEYAWEKNLSSPGGVHRIDFILRWYAWWDLARRCVGASGRSMGSWASYFLAAAYLHFRGVIRLQAAPNLVLALLLVAPLPPALAASRGWRGARHALAAVAALALLWQESFLPSPPRAARLLAGTGGVTPAYLLRVAGGAVDLLDVAALLAIVAACAVLARRIVLAPLAFAAVVAVPLAGASRGGTSIPGELERFFDDESRRSVRLPEKPAGDDLDVVVLHVCSMSWDDLRASGLDRSPFLRRFDLVLTAFNSVSSYTNPSAIRLLRATCGQPRHPDLYRPARPECYLLDALRRAGYQTWSAIDNDAPSSHFVEDIGAHGRADAPLPLSGLAVRQVDFDGTPIHDDGALLARWVDARRRAPARRAALYADLTTMHGGARRLDDARWWARGAAEIYRESGERLFANLEAFFVALRASERRTLVVFVPEHGAALAGTSFQPADIREVPLPTITTVPVAVKLVGPGLAEIPDRQLTVSKPTSYLAIAHLVASALATPDFRPEAVLSEDALARIPETRFVAENEATTVIRAGDDVYWRKSDGPFEEVPAALPAGAAAPPRKL